MFLSRVQRDLLGDEEYFYLLERAPFNHIQRLLSHKGMKIGPNMRECLQGEEVADISIRNVLRYRKTCDPISEHDIRRRLTDIIEIPLWMIIHLLEVQLAGEETPLVSTSKRKNIFLQPGYAIYSLFEPADLTWAVCRFTYRNFRAEKGELIFYLR